MMDRNMYYNDLQKEMQPDINPDMMQDEKSRMILAYVGFNLKSALESAVAAGVEDTNGQLPIIYDFLKQPSYLAILTKRIASSFHRHFINKLQVCDLVRVEELLQEEATPEFIAKSAIRNHALTYQELMDIRRSEIEKGGRY